MAEKFSLDELKAHHAELTEDIKKLAAEWEGQEFSEGARAEFEALKADRVKTEELIKELDERKAYLASLVDNPANVENEPRSTFQTRRPSTVPDDPTRIEEYRVNARNIDELDQAYTDGALKILDTRFRSAHPGVSKEDAQNDIARLLETIDADRSDDGAGRSIARRIIATSSPTYKREFATFLKTKGRVVGPEMERAASLTTTAGGFAVPVELDTTLILTSAGVINPVRNIARVRQTVVNTVEFISTTGVTASYGAELTEASDGAPTLAQPTLNIEKAQAFVPGSIEIFEDWAAIQEDMAMAFADAKNTLENTKFLTGLGHGSHEPQGLIAVGGATSVISSATTAVFAVADLYSLESALAPRWRQRASIVGNRAAFQKIRQFDTAGGASLWVQLQNSNPPTLLGYDAYEWSAYASTLTTSGSTILTIGDFNQFAIVDRIGMSVEFIPHLFGGSNRFPTGERGLFMYWRNSSQVLTPGLTANSAFQSLKLL